MSSFLLLLLALFLGELNFSSSKGNLEKILNNSDGVGKFSDYALTNDDVIRFR